MGQANLQRGLFYQLSLDSFVPAERPLRAIRPLLTPAQANALSALFQAHIRPNPAYLKPVERMMAQDADG